MTQKLNIVVVGPGLMGKKHIELLQQNKRTRVVAIVAPYSQEHHDYAASVSAPLFETLELCMKDVRIDGVIIASPNKFHADQAKLCITNQIPVLIEKPITDLLREAVNLLHLAENYNAKVLIGHHRAHSPIVKTVRQVIDEKTLGRLVTFMGSAQFYKPTNYFEVAPWRTLEGGGPILINLIHEIGIMRAFMGEIVAVQAIASNYHRGFLVEDTVAINLRFDCGALGTFILSDTAASARSWELTSGENPVYPYYPSEDCYFISGTKGSIAIPSMRIQYFSDEEKASWHNHFDTLQVPYVKINPLEQQLEHFIEMITKNVVPLVSSKDGLENLRVVEAIRKSVLTKKLVEVTEDYL